MNMEQELLNVIMLKQKISRQNREIIDRVSAKYNLFERQAENELNSSACTCHSSFNAFTFSKDKYSNQNIEELSAISLLPITLLDQSVLRYCSLDLKAPRKSKSPKFLNKHHFKNKILKTLLKNGIRPSF